MTCKCGSQRIMRVSGKTSDMFSVNIPHLDVNYNGYVPRDLQLGGGDYIGFTVCLDCGTIQRWQPISDEQIKETMNDYS